MKVGRTELKFADCPSLNIWLTRSNGDHLILGGFDSRASEFAEYLADRIYEG